MLKQPVTKDAGSNERESGRKKPTIGARRRSKSVGKPKLDSSLVKQPFRSYITVHDETHDHDVPSRKLSVTNSQVKKFVSLPSSVVVDENSSLASTMEDCSFCSTINRDRPVRTTSFSGPRSSNILHEDASFRSSTTTGTSLSRYKSSNVLHKDASFRSSRTPSLSECKSSTVSHKDTFFRAYTAMATDVMREVEPRIPEIKLDEVQFYKQIADQRNTDEDATDTADSEATDDPDENDENTESPAVEANTGDAEEVSAIPEDAPVSPEDAPADQIETEDGQPPAPSSDKPEESETGYILIVKFLLLAGVCKAVSLFFQPDKCTC